MCSQEMVRKTDIILKSPPRTLNNNLSGNNIRYSYDTWDIKRETESGPFFPPGTVCAPAGSVIPYHSMKVFLFTFYILIKFWSITANTVDKLLVCFYANRVEN